MSTVSMEARREDSARKLLILGGAVTTAHFLLTLWHLFLLVKTQPDTPKFLPPILILVNLLPVTGVAVFAKGFPTIAAAMIAVPLGVALAVGGYSHFLSPGSDNIFHMPYGTLTLTFQASAILLLLLEILGCWIGIRMFTHAFWKKNH